MTATPDPTQPREPPAPRRLSPRWLNLSWKVIVAADVGILLYGVLAVIRPRVLVAGFETYTGLAWDVFAAADVAVAAFILHGFRLIGVHSITIGVTLIVVAATAFRRGERWAWWVLLAGNTLAYGGPMVYDQVVGSIGPFEMLEYVGLVAVYAALAATASLLRRPPHDAPAPAARRMTEIGSAGR